MNKNLKKWIKKNLFNETGEPIRTRFSFGSNSWMLNNHPDKVQEIIDSTSFLKTDEPMSARIYSVLNGISAYPKCDRCGGDTKWHHNHRRFMNYCSKTCSNRSNAVSGKGAHIASAAVREKSRKTLLKNYGEDNFFKTERFREVLQTKFDRNSPSQFALTDDSYELLKNPEELKRLHHEEKLSHAEIAIKYGLAATTVNKAFQRHKIEVLSHPNSIGQKEILDYVRNELGHNAVDNDRTALGKLELDIWIPEIKVAIEYHGAHYHSSRFMRAGQHKYKLVACQNHGIRLLQFFDTEWRDKKEIVKSIIKAIIGDKKNPSEKRGYARKYKVRVVDKKTATLFFDENHLQGSKGV